MKNEKLRAEHILAYDEYHSGTSKFGTVTSKSPSDHAVSYS